MTESGFIPGFLCWDPSKVEDVVKDDAADQFGSVFLATHYGAPVFKREIGQTVGGSQVDEDAVLRDLETVATSKFVMPIVGRAGVGKSHLVKWLHRRMVHKSKTDGTSETRHLVYIGREDTTLRRVVERILERLEGEAFSELRNDLNRAAEDLDEAQAPNLLVYALAQRVQFETTPGEYPVEREWAKNELHTYLSNHLVREQLTKEGGVVDRFVREAVHGRVDEDKDRPFEFEPNDLLLDLGPARQELRGRPKNVHDMLEADSGLRRIVAELLNEHLDQAIWRLFDVTETRISDVLRGVRELLLGQRQELFIFIEDFRVLQGIRRTLLSNLIAPTREGDDDTGREVLCPIRVVMAVTSGYFESLETVTSRAEFASFEYSLDVEVGEGQKKFSENDAEAFIGRYLNAARLGRAELDKGYREAGVSESEDEDESRQWVPNACTSCELLPLCHDGFQHTSDGYGLYPFNRPALRRMLRARQGGQFDPRKVLGQVVLWTLGQHGKDLAQGSFPDPLYADRYIPAGEGLAPELLARLARQLDGQRRAALLALWGDRPDHLVDLHPAIHEAFRIDQLGDVDVQQPEVSAPSSEDERKAASAATDATDPEAAIQKDLRDLDRWSSGDPTVRLEDRLARRLRQRVHDAVVARAEWDLEFRRAPQTWIGASGRFRPGYVRLRNAAGEKVAVRADGVTVEVPANPEMAVVLRAIVRHDHYGHWRFPGGTAAYVAYGSQVDAWADEVLQQFRTTRRDGPNLDPVDEVTDLLLVGAQVLGYLDAAGVAPDALVSACLTPPPSEVPARGQHWDAVSKICGGSDPGTGVASREALIELLFQHVGASRGATGGVQIVDGTRLLPAVSRWQQAARMDAPAMTGGAPAGSEPGVAKHHERLAAALPRAVTEQVAMFGGLASVIKGDLGTVSDPQEISETIIATLDRVAARGLVEVSMVDEARPKIALLGRTETSRLAEMVTRSDQASQLARVSKDTVPAGIIPLLAGDWRDVMLAATAVSEARKLIDKARRELDRQISVAAGGDDNRARREIDAALERLADALKTSGAPV